MKRIVLVAWIVGVAVALWAWRVSRVEGWTVGDNGHRSPPPEVTALVKRHCSVGQSLQTLMKAHRSDWAHYSSLYMKNACKEGQKMFKDAKNNPADASGCPKGPCPGRTSRRLYPCLGANDTCCKADGSDCVPYKDVQKSVKGTAAFQKKNCPKSARRGDCIGGFREKCTKGSNGKLEWRCCNAISDECPGDPNANRYTEEQDAKASGKQLGCSTDGTSFDEVFFDHARGKCCQAKGGLSKMACSRSFARSYCCEGVDLATGNCTGRGKTTRDGC